MGGSGAGEMLGPGGMGVGSDPAPDRPLPPGSFPRVPDLRTRRRVLTWHGRGRVCGVQLWRAAGRRADRGSERGSRHQHRSAARSERNTAYSAPEGAAQGAGGREGGSAGLIKAPRQPPPGFFP